MQLGKFSLSLTVKDLKTSRAFYEKLGFEVYGGDEKQDWLVLRNGDTTIGLFQNMFQKNMLTFNPGWDKTSQPLSNFTDVRELQRQLKKEGIQMVEEADESTQGPAYFTIVDPDGNPILFDQHI